MLKKSVFFILFFFASIISLRAETKALTYPSTETPRQEFFVGEKLNYSIRYLGLPIGRAEAWIKEIVEIRDRKAYHIVVNIASNNVVDVVCRVRGEHHTYIDVKSLYSLQYQIKTTKEPKQTALEMNFDHKKNTVNYFFPRKNIHKEFLIVEKSMDQLALAYFARTLPLKPHEKYMVPVHAEQKQWQIEIPAFKTQRMEFGKIGTFETVEIRPQLNFVSALTKKGSVKAWMSLDERRIPLQLSARIPFMGSVKAVLVSYTPGTSHKK